MCFSEPPFCSVSTAGSTPSVEKSDKPSPVLPVSPKPSKAAVVFDLVSEPRLSDMCPVPKDLTPPKSAGDGKADARSSPFKLFGGLNTVELHRKEGGAGSSPVTAAVNMKKAEVTPPPPPAPVASRSCELTSVSSGAYSAVGCRANTSVVSRGAVQARGMEHARPEYKPAAAVAQDARMRGAAKAAAHSCAALSTPLSTPSDAFSCSKSTSPTDAFSFSLAASRGAALPPHAAPYGSSMLRPQFPFYPPLHAMMPAAPTPDAGFAAAAAAHASLRHFAVGDKLRPDPTGPGSQFEGRQQRSGSCEEPHRLSHLQPEKELCSSVGASPPPCAERAGRIPPAQCDVASLNFFGSGAGTFAGGALSSPPLHHAGGPLGAKHHAPSYDQPFSSVPPHAGPFTHLSPSFPATPTFEPFATGRAEPFMASHSATLKAAHSRSAERKSGMHARSKPAIAAPAATRSSETPHKSSRSSKASKKSSKCVSVAPPPPHVEVEPYLAANAALFDHNRSLTPYFPLASLSPPLRQMAEAPTYFPSNLFGAAPSPSPRSLAVPSKPLQHKGSMPGDLGTFNSLFPAGRHQNGLPFQPPPTTPGFAMNHPMHTPVHHHHHASSMHHANAMPPPPPPHHMPNFSLTNLFVDMNGGAGLPPPVTSTPGQPDAINMSPIKFAHGNAMLPSQPPPLDHHHHHHQGAAIYSNRPQMPAPPGLHNLFGQHHGFDGRAGAPPINSPMAPPFGGPAHSFAMPPLNFQMHDH